MSSPEKDKEFEPTIEMMIHDFDDEQTLEEEERQAAADANPDNELDQLQKEGDMPLEQLLAMYYNQPMAADEDEESFEEDEDDEVDAKKAKSKGTEEKNPETVESDLEDESDLKRLYPAGVNSLSAILAAAEESDVDYEPDESDNRKKIMVGSEHQAQIPEIGAPADSSYNEGDDKLVWSGNDMSHEEIVKYLQKIKQLYPPRNIDSTWTTGDVALATTPQRHVRDDEKALSLLRECGNNVEEAISRVKSEMEPVETCWSEEECVNFESGLLTYGKNFHEIKETKVPSKTVGEIIQFYYHWKKSERYDAFVSKNRLDKKKYNANSGSCIMDRFLDDQEGTSITGTNGMHLRDRTQLTFNNTLLSADAKRRHDKHEPQGSNDAPHAGSSEPPVD